MGKKSEHHEKRKYFRIEYHLPKWEVKPIAIGGVKLPPILGQRLKTIFMHNLP